MARQIIIHKLVDDIDGGEAVKRLRQAREVPPLGSGHVVATGSPRTLLRTLGGVT